jgi:hypothetical protein
MKFASRCHNLFASTGLAATARTIAGLRTAGVVEPGPAGRANAYLSIPEVFVTDPGKDRNTYDFLVFVTFDSADEEGTIAAFVGPEALRSRSGIISAGLLMTDIPVAAIPDDCRRLAVVLYRIKRDRKQQRIVDAIEGAASALDYRRDARGSLKLAEAILDRLEILCRSSEVCPLMGGTHAFSHQVEQSDQSPYVAILKADGDATMGRELWVREDRLCSGRSPETAMPWRLQDFMLLRISDASGSPRQGPSPQQLRRQHALTGGVFLEEDDSEDESHLEREARLRTMRHLTSIYGRQGMQRIPMVTPIAIEVAHDVIPVVASGQDALNPRFQELINLMREALRSEYGLEVPPVRIRGNETDMPGGTYLIMLQEIPLVLGTIRLDKGLCNDTVERLRLLHVEAEAATNPANGNECAWVPKESWQMLRDAGLQIWDAPEYIILHLSAVIRKNLSEFAGIQAVSNLIRETSKELYARIHSAPGGLARFTSVLQALLAEEVPIKALAAIGERYLKLTGSHIPAHEISEELRCLDDIRPHLHGNQSRTPLYRLGMKFVELLANGIVRNGDAAVLAIEPQPCQEALAAVRSEVNSLPPMAKNPVLVVDDWRLRPFARLLVELEFPHLWVLARRELLDPDSMQTLAVIELE